MKSLIIFGLLFNLASLSAGARDLISGSDTMGGVMTDAIIAAGMDNVIGYVGGGSGVGEKALVNGEIGMTAMSRAMKPEALAQAAAAGVTPVGHIVGLDGLIILVNKANPMAGTDFSTLVRIFSCEFTSWSQVPNSGKAGAIHAFRRNDQSGTTDTFKSLTGIKKFGDCVTVLNETADIAEKTATDVDAIGYAGLSGHKEGNRSIGVAKSAGEAFVTATTATIRNGLYPLARSLYIYEATGARKPNQVEAQLLEQVLDRSFLDPILQDHDFVTLN